MKSYYQQIRAVSSEFSLQVKPGTRPAVKQLSFNDAKPLELGKAGVQLDLGKAGLQLKFKAGSDDLFLAKSKDISFAPHEIVDDAPAQSLLLHINHIVQSGGATFNSSAGSTI